MALSAADRLKPSACRSTLSSRTGTESDSPANSPRCRGARGLFSPPSTRTSRPPTTRDAPGRKRLEQVELANARLHNCSATHSQTLRPAVRFPDVRAAARRDRRRRPSAARGDARLLTEAGLDVVALAGDAEDLLRKGLATIRRSSSLMSTSSGPRRRWPARGDRGPPPAARDRRARTLPVLRRALRARANADFRAARSTLLFGEFVAELAAAHQGTVVSGRAAERSTG